MKTALKQIYHLTLKPISGDSHQTRLNSFYREQAEGYDTFREKLLHGRRDLINQASKVVPAGSVWLDLGCGTAANLDYYPDFTRSCEKIYLYDLCEPLLEQAQKRTLERQLRNTEVICADVCKAELPQADLITFSYSLTMIPNWFLAVENALSALKPGGIFAAVDFYVSRKYPDHDKKRHTQLTRLGWQSWFSFDNVNLNPDHLPFFETKLQTVFLSESRGSVPYLPLVKAPYYVYLGRKV